MLRRAPAAEWRCGAPGMAPRQRFGPPPGRAACPHVRLSAVHPSSRPPACLPQIASFTIVVQQLKSIYDSFFISCCERCRGTGIITCPHVGGARGLGWRGRASTAWGGDCCPPAGMAQALGPGRGRSVAKGRAGEGRGAVVPRQASSPLTSLLALLGLRAVPPARPAPPRPAPPRPAPPRSATAPRTSRAAPATCARAAWRSWTTRRTTTPASTAAR